MVHLSLSAGSTHTFGLPSFFVLNTLLGLRRDFVEATRALVATQAGLAVVLGSLAPFTLLWYASSADYLAALRFNGLMFAAASFTGQWLLVAVQLAWVLRPFVGAPNAPVQFIRPESWSNAYVVVAQLIYDALAR